MTGHLFSERNSYFRFAHTERRTGLNFTFFLVHSRFQSVPLSISDADRKNRSSGNENGFSGVSPRCFVQRNGLPVPLDKGNADSGNEIVVLPSAHAQSVTSAAPKWHIPAEVTLIHATAPSQCKNLDGHAVNIVPVKTLKIKLLKGLASKFTHG